MISGRVQRSLKEKQHVVFIGRQKETAVEESQNTGQRRGVYPRRLIYTHLVTFYKVDILSSFKDILYSLLTLHLGRGGREGAANADIFHFPALSNVAHPSRM